MLQFDDILKYLGEFGPYQRRRYFLLCLMAIIPAFHAFAQVFLAAETDYWCRVPELQSYRDDNCTSEGVPDETCIESLKNFSIPVEASSDSCGNSFTYSNCYRYNITNIKYGADKVITDYTNDTKKCDYGWEYDRSQYKSSVFQEFDLVCDNYYLGALSSSMYMVGLFIGAGLFGALSDKIGRLSSLMISNFALIIFGTACAFSPNIIAYSVFRVGVGACVMGNFLVAFVLSTELVGPSKRVFAGIVIEFFFSFGYMLLALLAYLIREWWILQLVTTLPSIFFITYWWIIPESPRWLLSAGKIKRAEKIIRKCAQVNKRTVPESVYDEMHGIGQQKTKEEVEEDEKASFLDLFRLPNMRKKTLNIFFNWFTNSLVYYGLSLNTSNLGGDDYLNAFISGAVEIPAYAISLYIQETFLGRRWSLFVTMVLGGVACILTLAVPDCEYQWIGVTLAMIGKFGISASFAIIYVFSAELYPTPVRTIGMGMSSMFARIGGVLAPQMILIGQIWEPLPILIFGTTSILAGILAVLLPETRNQKLPETMEEGERFGKKCKSTAEQAKSLGHDNKALSMEDKKERYMVENNADRDGISNPSMDTSTGDMKNSSNVATKL
ncbi:organic cation transporter protein-like [Glandiceps talaboti]